MLKSAFYPQSQARIACGFRRPVYFKKALVCKSSSEVPVAVAVDDAKVWQGQSLSAATKKLDDVLGQQTPTAEADAEKLVTTLQEAGLLNAFGRGRQLPKRIYTIDELRLNKVEPEKLLAPKDESLNSVRNTLQAAAAAGFIALCFAQHLEAGQVLGCLVAVTFITVADQVANMGGGEALIVDTIGRILKPQYAQRVAYHEAGHFLVAYLLGLLPRAYTLSSLDAFNKYRALNVQAGCQFCDSAFSSEIKAAKLRSSSLERYSCVALAGVVTEYLRFGQAEGGLGDVMQLDSMFSALQFSQLKADGEVRWAVLNVAQLLRRHAGLHDKLATTMGSGASVGACIRLIEEQLEGCDDV